MRLNLVNYKVDFLEKEIENLGFLIQNLNETE